MNSNDYPSEEENIAKTMDTESKQENLQDAFLHSLDLLTEGNVIIGTIVQVGSDDVFVDIGYKAEGRIPLEEFKSVPEPGAKIPVILLRKEIRNGGVLVSYNKALKKIAMKDIKQSYQDQMCVTGHVSDYDDNTGYTVLLNGDIHATCPLSQIDIQTPDNPKQYIGMKAEFAVDRIYRNNKVDILLSRKHWMKIERNIKQKRFFETTSVGDIVKGTVKHFVSFGAFIDLGGFDALLHVNDISWNYVNKPKERLKKGQVIHTKVITMEPETKRIGLSLRHLQPDPWESFEEKYEVGTVIEGRVTKLIKTAFFVELEPGIEGLVHISELSWAKYPPKLSNYAQVGDVMKVKILDYNLENKKITLGVKQTRENPWPSVQERYPVGLRLRAPIVKITPMGLFVRLEEDVDAFLHVKDISWTEHVETTSFNVNDTIECVVIESNPVTCNVRVSIKDALENPWNLLIDKYHVGSVIEGNISAITDFGIIVKTEFGIDGLVHKSQLAESKELHQYTQHDPIKVRILEILPDKNRLALSERLNDEESYSASMQKKYIHDESKEEHAVSISDFL